MAEQFPSDKKPMPADAFVSVRHQFPQNEGFLKDKTVGDIRDFLAAYEPKSPEEEQLLMAARGLGFQLHQTDPDDWDCPRVDGHVLTNYYKVALELTSDGESAPFDDHLGDASYDVSIYHGPRLEHESVPTPGTPPNDIEWALAHLREGSPEKAASIGCVALD